MQQEKVGYICMLRSGWVALLIQSAQHSHIEDYPAETVPAQSCIPLAFVTDELCLALSNPHGKLLVSSLLFQYYSMLGLLLTLQSHLFLQLSL